MAAFHSQNSHGFKSEPDVFSVKHRQLLLQKCLYSFQRMVWSRVPYKSDSTYVIILLNRRQEIFWDLEIICCIDFEICHNKISLAIALKIFNGNQFLSTFGRRSFGRSVHHHSYVFTVCIFVYHKQLFIPEDAGVSISSFQITKKSVGSFASNDILATLSPHIRFHIKVLSHRCRNGHFTDSSMFSRLRHQFRRAHRK